MHAIFPKKCPTRPIRSCTLYCAYNKSIIENCSPGFHSLLTKLKGCDNIRGMGEGHAMNWSHPSTLSILLLGERRAERFNRFLAWTVQDPMLGSLWFPRQHEAACRRRQPLEKAGLCRREIEIEKSLIY